MTVLFALLSALCYGTSDFVGGFMATRIPTWMSAFCAQVGGAVAMAVFALLTAGHPDAASLAWGAVSGVATGVGILALYRGLAVGRMGVVAPISGVTGAILPAAIGVAGGDRPSTIAWLGLALALPAVFLVARAPATESESGHGSGAMFGLLAGLGFGGGFAAIAQIPASAGHWPITLEMVTGAAFTALVAMIAREPWLPRTLTPWWAGAGGTLGAAALALFLAANNHGMLTVAAVLSSLYPAATVAWAVVLLKERIHRGQAVGLAATALAVTLVAVG
ncbi:EamA family transporter [Nocardioides sp. Kera G14]|uniref:EamA family transporter n=1 Tax=Nocardioides sp. Kera G14 TaxID=2884264 RepID=UPI001D124D7D|nr:EamA family transporter [Nocardioides sp. Kera G14]UDY22387.1 EamA family transporter [Nocardioides sp. Kera G14]